MNYVLKTRDVLTVLAKLSLKILLLGLGRVLVAVMGEWWQQRDWRCTRQQSTVCNTQVGRSREKHTAQGGNECCQHGHLAPRANENSPRRSDELPPIPCGFIKAASALAFCLRHPSTTAAVQLAGNALRSFCGKQIFPFLPFARPFPSPSESI